MPAINFIDKPFKRFYSKFYSKIYSKLLNDLKLRYLYLIIHFR